MIPACRGSTTLVIAMHSVVPIQRVIHHQDQAYLPTELYWAIVGHIRPIRLSRVTGVPGRVGSWSMSLTRFYLCSAVTAEASVASVKQHGLMECHWDCGILT